MRRGLLVVTTVGAIALGSLVVLLGMQPVGGVGLIAALGSPPASPAATLAGSPSPVVQPAATPWVAPTLPPPTGPRLTDAVVAALQVRLDSMRAKHSIPGISASIILADGTSWNGVSGMADVAARRRVTPNTAFAVASISKTFMAALILDLVSEGRIGLEDKASEYLPEHKMLAGITIRMLLNHTSGLHDYFDHPKIDRALRAEPARAWTATQSLGYVTKPYFKPGTGWAYSNTNYLLLGLIAERAGGQPLAEQLRSRYFEPLGLDSAYYQAVERSTVPTAHGYRIAGSGSSLRPVDLADGTGVMPFRSVVTAAGGAGSIAATSLDVARWSRALYGGRVLDPPRLDLMLGDFDPAPGYKPSIPYGLGVQALDVNGFPTFGHSGRFIGFRGVVRYVAGDDIAIAVLTNQSRVDPGLIAASLLRIVLPPPGPCGACPEVS